jgi:indolepyruvate ferredoxin oxidoreductase beta subunit
MDHHIHHALRQHPQLSRHGGDQCRPAKISNVIAIDIEQLAKDNNVPRSANVILLGAAQKALGIENDKLEEAIRRVFGRKGDEVVEANIKALAIGRNAQK